MLKQIFKTYGRHRSNELIAALLAISSTELVQDIVELFTSGELRFRTKRKVRSARALCHEFYEYHEANPDVADWFVKAAQSLRDEQRPDYSIGALTERVRWHVQMGIIKSNGLRIRNEFRALYARLVMMRDPSLCGMFEIHPSKTDDVLVIDGQSWKAFAAGHHSALWPSSSTEPMKKPPVSVSSVEKKAASNA